jgi:hypothetical protein
MVLRAANQAFTVHGYIGMMGQRTTTIAILVGAGVVGTLVGVGTTPRPVSSAPAPFPIVQPIARHDVPSVPVAPAGLPDAVGPQSRPAVVVERPPVASPMRTMAVATGISRAREPRVGDQWGGCNDARAAGTAPIYSSEPGYRIDMDGDGDGIACENPRS